MISNPAVCFLLDVTLLDSFFIQILYELISLHPVDERADVAAVAKKRPASQVQSTSCKDRRWHAVMLDSRAGSLKVCVSCARPIKYCIISYKCLQRRQQKLFILFCRKHEDLQFFVNSKVCAQAYMLHTFIRSHALTFHWQFTSKVVLWELNTHLEGYTAMIKAVRLDFLMSIAHVCTDMKASELYWTHEGTQELLKNPLETVYQWEKGRRKEVRGGWQ